MTMKRVLIYNSNEPLPEQGGMERVTDLLAKALRDYGLHVILLYKIPNRIGKKYNPPVKLYRLPDNGASEYLSDLAKAEQIDIIIDQTETGIIGPNGIFKSRKEADNHIGHSVKYIAVQHSSALSYIKNMDYTVLPSKAPGIISMAKRTLVRHTILPLKRWHAKRYAGKKFTCIEANYDKVVTLSESFVDEFIYFCPKARRDKLTAIPDLNTYDHTDRSEKETRVLFVGRLMINPKGVDRLLRIWKKIENLHPEWLLDIVGDGADRDALETMADELELKRVEFHGYKNPGHYYERASIFCMTSTYEGFGMVLTESMQHGCVPMAFNSYSSAKDIIDDGISGFLIPPFDEDEYSNRLNLLIEDTRLREKMSEAAIEKSKKFSKENIVKKWISLFDSLKN